MITKRKLNIPIGETLPSILKYLQENGFPCYIAGGAVRDVLLNIEPKDIDIEVYNIDFETLNRVLSMYGEVIGGDSLGKSFSAIKFKDSEGNYFDFTLPRRDTKTGDKHTDFTIEVDKNMSLKEACSRRDFTINSMLYDYSSEEIIDYFSGQVHIKDRILKATSLDTFSEDKLRVLRGMQFFCRFNLSIEDSTLELCRELAKAEELYKTETNPDGISKERVTEEWMKLLTKASHPGKLIPYLEMTGWIKYFPEIQAIIGIEQSPEFHPEGNCDIHTELVTNEARVIADLRNLEGDARVVYILAGLCHDLGKATTTIIKDGKISSPKHAIEGTVVTLSLLESIGIKKSIIEQVIPLVQFHMCHFETNSYETASKQIRRLSNNLHPANIQQLYDLVWADHSGRHPLPKEAPITMKRLLAAAINQKILLNKPTNLLTGNDVIPYYQNLPGPHIGTVLTNAYQAYLDNKFSTRQEALTWMDNYLRKELQFISGKDLLPYFDNKPNVEIGEILEKMWRFQKKAIYSNRNEALKYLSHSFKFIRALKS